MLGNVIVGQSGGPTSVINSSLAGVFKTAKDRGANKVYGMLHGIKGLLDKQYVDLSEKIKTDIDIDLLKRTPSSYLGSCRYKLPEISDDRETYEKIFEILKELNISYFFYIGGNDSMDTIKKLSDYALLIGSDIKFMGVPKTIDNDLAVTDHTPGFGSAAKFIAATMKEIIRDGLVYDYPTVTIVEIMGRNAGYLAVWCGIANGAEDILIPEKYDYDEQKLIDNIVESRKKGKKHHIIVNAEGIGHSEAMAKRIEAATGIETRATILGHMQRGGSPTCKDRVYASMMGALAVDLLVAGKRSRVVGYRHGEFVDFDINEALAMQKNVDSYMWEVCNSLSHNYSK